MNTACGNCHTHPCSCYPLPCFSCGKEHDVLDCGASNKGMKTSTTYHPGYYYHSSSTCSPPIEEEDGDALESDEVECENEDELEEGGRKYYKRSEMQVADIWDAFDLDPYSASIVKYLCRRGHKEGADQIEDITKVIWYANRLLANLKQTKTDEPPKS